MGFDPRDPQGPRKLPPESPGSLPVRPGPKPRPLPPAEAPVKREPVEAYRLVINVPPQYAMTDFVPGHCPPWVWK